MTHSRRVPRRERGTGTIVPRRHVRSDGTEVVTYQAQLRVDGVRHTLTRRTEREARRALSELRRRREGGRLGAPGASRLTVAAHFARWLATKRDLRPRSWARLEEHVRGRVVPGFGGRRLPPSLRGDLEALAAAGGMRLTAVATADVEALLAGATASGLAPRTVRQLLRVLRAGFVRAVHDRLLARDPTAGVAGPRVTAPRQPVLTVAQVEALLETAAARADRLRYLWAVCAYTGMRQGELLGLRWDDVDWRYGGAQGGAPQGRLELRLQQSKPKGGRSNLTEIKTEAGRRDLPLPPPARDALLAQRRLQAAERLAQGAGYRDQGLVFASRRGTPLLDRNVIRAFHRLAAAAGLPESVHPHTLRHTAASLLAAAGVDAATIAALLGHTDAGFTYRVYVKPYEARTAEAALRLGRLFGRASPPRGTETG